MTRGASSLTRRASVAAAPRPNPTSLANFVPMIEAFVRLGCDREGLLAAARLTQRDLEDPDAVLSNEGCAAMFGLACSTVRLPNLGLRLAMEIPIGAYPLLEYLVVTAETVGDGARHLERYLRINNSPTELRIEEEPARVRLVATAGNPLSIEFTFALAVLHLRRETGDRFRASALSFRHRVDDPGEYSRLLDCSVQTESESDALTMTRAAWSMPMPRRDSALHGLLRRQADQVLAAQASDGTFVAELRRVLAHRVAGGDTTLAAVARHLAASPRSVQRRLAEEGLTYQGILGAVRRESAEQYLSGSRLSVGEVGYLLGFSEPAAFHRAFKRWTGITPLEFRRALSARRPPAPRTSRRPRA
jgi:AraC-like DNA-binding protein